MLSRAAPAASRTLKALGLRRPLHRQAHCRPGGAVAAPKRIESVIADWSGSLNDALGIVATNGFVRACGIHKVPVTFAQAQQPMGLGKGDHVRRLLSQSKRVFKSLAEHNALVDTISTEYIASVKSLVRDPEQCALVDGAREAIHCLVRQHGVMVGVTTGYPREVADAALLSAYDQGVLCALANAASDDPGIDKGRPSSRMLWQVVAQQLGLRPLPAFGGSNSHQQLWSGHSPVLNRLGPALLDPYHAGQGKKDDALLQRMRFALGPSIVKCGDTTNDILEAFDAGCWSVGIVGTSSYIGVDSLHKWLVEMPAEEKQSRRVACARRLLSSSRKALPDYLVRSFADVPRVVRDINQRFREHDSPVPNSWLAHAHLRGFTAAGVVTGPRGYCTPFFC